ncbi:MAG: UDP-glucose 4-epimerase GalE [Bryobacteraceae bacterium]|nr:UDP-glucose 4-epimerase GalE [Bryobacteraceae bacterium]MDW8378784.1 UDP-glucose 4-epimerase GalE [Bryobacterales bacterium]
MRVLVTGGAGYIGSHVAKALARAGHQPIVVDNLSMGHRWAVRWGPLIEADLADRARLCELLKGVDAVIHLAASAYVGESVRDPGKYYRNNFANSIHLLDAMVANHVQQIVFSSTAAVYGEPEQVPIPETEKRRPINPYGESKFYVEEALAAYARAHGLRWLSLRYFNAAGADLGGEIGEMHSPETHLIPLAIYAALKLRPHIEIYGDDYPTPDGTAVRDYIHVDDLAEGHVRGLEYLQEGGQSAAMNLGVGRGYSVRSVIDVVQRISGAPVCVKQAPRRPGDPAELVAAPDKAKRLLHWQPRHSDLETIVTSAVRWHRQALESGLHRD